MIAGLKPYQRMKDSGVPWLGEVPAHWEVLPNRAIFTEVNERDHPNADMLSVTITRGVIRQKALLEDGTKKDSSNLDKSAYKLVRPGDIVYNKMRAWQGAIGRSGYNGIVSPAYVVERPRAGISSHYLHYLLRTPAFAKEAERWSYGITSDMWSLRPEDFKMIYSCLPTVSEQADIVRYLDHVDRPIRLYIRAKQRLIKLLEEQKQAIIHRAVTRGLHPNVRLKYSGVEWLGDVPEHWEVVPLSRVLMQRKEKNDPVRTTNILSLSLKAGVIPYAEKEAGGNKAKEDVSAYMLAYPGDIVVNSMNVVVGSVGLSKYFGAVSPVYYMLRPRDSLDSVEYFSSAFCDVAFQRSLFGLGNGIMYIASKSSGKLNTIRLRIPMTRLKRVLLPRPPATEQGAIVAYLSDITADVVAALSRIERDIRLLREYGTRLIADVVTGKLDVREAAARLPFDSKETEPLEELESQADMDEGEAADDAAPLQDAEA